jgi:hypothetical protein
VKCFITKPSCLLAFLTIGSTPLLEKQRERGEHSGHRRYRRDLCRNSSLDHLYGLFPGANGLQDLTPGTLPHVAFYKPQGNLNMPPG